MSTMVKIGDRVLSREQRQAMDDVVDALRRYSWARNCPPGRGPWTLFWLDDDRMGRHLVVLQAMGVLRRYGVAHVRGWVKLCYPHQVVGAEARLSARLVQDPNFDPSEEYFEEP